MLAHPDGGVWAYVGGFRPHLRFKLACHLIHEKIKNDIALGPSVDTQWAKIRTELDAISGAFNSPSN